MNLFLLHELKQMKPELKPNTYRTIKGQILSGNDKAARVGMDRLKKKRKGGDRDERE